MNSLLSLPSERTVKQKICRVQFGATSFVTCPYCQRKGCVRRDERFQCQRCGKAWSLTSLTWMKGMKLSWQQFWGLLWAYTNKIPLDQTQKLLDISRPTIYRWFELFRQHLPVQDHIRLDQVVVMDEAYFGHRKNSGAALIAAKQKGTNKVAGVVIPASSVQRSDITPFVRQHVVPGSKLWTDGALIYRGIKNLWPVDHAYDIHSKAEFGKTSEIEGFFGCLRTFLRRMYHHVTTQKLPQYVLEYQCRLMYPEMFTSPLALLQIILPKFSFA